MFQRLQLCSNFSKISKYVGWDLRILLPDLKKSFEVDLLLQITTHVCVKNFLAHQKSSANTTFDYKMHEILFWKYLPTVNLIVTF